jgi:hypothetical protein
MATHCGRNDGYGMIIAVAVVLRKKADKRKNTTRRTQLERYMQFALKFCKHYEEHIDKKFF